jgi:NADH-quinone oxidoreductase subunit N
MLDEFEGAAYKRPYISAMLTIFIFSLLGLPPFLGFFGVFSALSYLAKQDSFYQFGYIILMMIVLSYGYLQIIKNIYFEKSKENFDRADSGIYVAVLLNALLMIVIMLKPQYLMQDTYFMIESMFQ